MRERICGYLLSVSLQQLEQVYYADGRTSFRNPTREELEHQLQVLLAAANWCFAKVSSGPFRH